MIRATALIWTAMLAGTFLYVYPPRSLSLASLLEATWQWDVFMATWVRHLLAGGFLILWAGALAAWGAPALQIIGRLRLMPGMRPLFGAGLGFGGLGLTILGLGLSGLLSPWVLGAAAVLPAAIARSWRLLPARFPGIPGDRSIWPLAAAVPLLAALPGMLSPETSWDAVVYHLRLPEFYLMERKIFFVYDSPFAGFPCLAEMHYLLGQALLGLERLPKLQHAACWLATARILYLAARPISIPAAYAVSLAWTCLPIGIHLAGIGYIDLATAFMVTLCAAALSGGAARVGLRAAVTAGIFAGLAFSTKYTGGIAVVALLACLAGPQRTFKRLVGALVAAVFLAAPWLARNCLSVGNPTYPFLARLFGGQVTPSSEYELAHPAPWGGGFSELAGKLQDLAFSDGGGVEAVLGPLWPAVFVPALLFGSANRLWRFFAAALVCWLLLPLNCRFLLPFIPAAYLSALPAWRDRNLRPAVLFALLTLAPLGAWHGIRASISQFDSLPPALGLRSYSKHMSLGMLPEPEYWRGAKETNRRLAPDGRLIFLGGIKSYGFDMRASVSHQTHNVLPLLHLARRAESAKRLAIVLRQHGFTHLAYLPRALADFLASFDPQVTDREAGVLIRWLEIGTHFEFREGEFLLYSLQKPGKARRLGRVPLLEDEAIVALRDPKTRMHSRATAQLIDLAPDSSSAALVAGIRELANSPLNTGSALRRLQLAAKSEDACPLAWRGIGFIMLQRGNMAAAMANLKAAIDLSPSDAEIRYDLGRALLQAGLPELAVVHLTAAARLAPGQPEIARALAAAEAARR